MAESKLLIASAWEAREEYLRTAEWRALCQSNPKAVRVCVAPGCTAPSLLGKGRRGVLRVHSVTGDDADSVMRVQRVACSCKCIKPMFWDEYADLCSGMKPEIWIRGTGKSGEKYEFAREPRESDFAPKRKGGKPGVARRSSKLGKVRQQKQY